MTESQRLLRLWWVPLVFSVVMAGIIFVIGLFAIGWAAFDPGFFGVFLFVLAISYFCAGGAFVFQVVADLRERQRRRDKPDRERMLVEERALIERLVNMRDDADVRAGRWLRRRLVLRHRLSMVGHVLVVPALPPLFLFVLWINWHEGIGLFSARWQHRLFVVGCVVSVGFAIVWLVIRLRGLLDDPILVEGAITEVGKWEGEDLGDAALGATGVVGTNMEVDVRRAWRVATGGLVLLPWTGSHGLERTRPVARTVAPGEDVFLVCTSDRRAVGRLGPLARRAPRRTPA